MSKLETSIEIQASELARALNLVTSTVENRNTVPVLSNLLVCGNQSGLEITGTDLDRWCTEFVPNAGGKGKIKSFQTTLPARELLKIAKAIPGDARISLTIDGSKAHISACADMSGGKPVNYTLHTLPAEDFPLASEFEPTATFTLPAAEVAQTIGAVGFATSDETTRYYLNGMFFHICDGALVAAATDGHRLARRTIGKVAGAENLPDVIVHNKTLNLLAAMVAKQKEELLIEASATRICFSIGTAQLTAKTIDGTFPDYTRVIPTRNDKLARVDPVRMAAAVKRVQLIATEKTRAVRCQFSKGALALSVVSPENGEAREEIRIDYDGEDVSIGFNTRYLIEMLERLPGDCAEIHLDDPAAPTIFRLNEKAANLFVQMPMRI